MSKKTHKKKNNGNSFNLSRAKKCEHENESDCEFVARMIDPKKMEKAIEKAYKENKVIMNNGTIVIGSTLEEVIKLNEKLGVRKDD